MAFLGIHILTTKQVEALKLAGASEVNKAVAALKQTELGATIAADIAAIANTKMSGADKFAAVLANTAPLVVRYVAKGGVPAVVDDVMDIARQLVQAIYNDTQSLTAGKIARAIIKFLGLK